MLSKRRGKKYKLFRKCILASKMEARIVYNKHNVASYSQIANTSYYSIISPSNFSICTHNQIESCRKIVARSVKRIKPKAYYYSPLVFTLPITVKSKNSRMGKGKGKFSDFVARVKALEPIFVLRNVSRNRAVSLANKMRHKLPVRLTVCTYTYRYAGDSLF